MKDCWNILMRKGDSRMKTSKVVSLLLVSWSKYIHACLKILKMIGESKKPLWWFGFEQVIWPLFALGNVLSSVE